MGNTQDSNNGKEKDEEKGDVGGARQFKGKNNSIRLKLQRMRKKSLTKKNHRGSSSISTSDQQLKPASNGHHISYLTSDEIRNLQVSYFFFFYFKGHP